MNLGFLIIHPIKHSNYVKSLLHLCNHSENI